MVVKRFEVWLIELRPTRGSEISKPRPCVIVSPDEANTFLMTVTVVPLTKTIKNYPTRLNSAFLNVEGQLAVDQIRSLDKIRLIHRLGKLDSSTSKKLCDLINETFKF